MKQSNHGALYAAGGRGYARPWCFDRCDRDDTGNRLAPRAKLRKGQGQSRKGGALVVKKSSGYSIGKHV